MKIVADENIPYVHEFFDRFGQIKTHAGRTLGAAEVKDADILLVRSVTRVDESLLAGSRVKFVGTCTIGVDHLDVAYLKEQKIQYSSAPGCNAGGVLQYDFAALAYLEPNWQKQKIAIIGCGNVGRRIYQALKGVGVQCVVYDPFKSLEDVPDLVSLDEALSADVICMHTPYTKGGDFPSHHMINAESLKKIKSGALLLNAGRGGAIDNKALLDRLNRDASLRVVLDVWEGEPNINQELLKKVDIASPHIAGYSFEGKLNGTSMICQALADYLGAADEAFVSEIQTLSESIKGAPSSLTFEQINQLISSTYSIQEDDRRLREALANAAENQLGAAFDQLRKFYPQRREFEHFSINKCSISELGALGFKLNNA